MSSQGNIKGHVFQTQAWIPLMFMLNFDFYSLYDSVCKILKAYELTANQQLHPLLRLLPRILPTTII